MVYNNEFQVTLSVICEHFGVTVEQLCCSTRTHSWVKARMFLAHFTDKKITTTSLGRWMGGRDHSTIIYYRQQINNYLSIKDALYTKDYTACLDRINYVLNYYNTNGHVRIIPKHRALEIVSGVIKDHLALVYVDEQTLDDIHSALTNLYINLNMSK
jgi:hypothetical protein